MSSVEGFPATGHGNEVRSAHIRRHRHAVHIRRRQPSLRGLGHLRHHVDRSDPALRTDLRTQCHRGQSGAASEIEDPLAGSCGQGTPRRRP